MYDRAQVRPATDRLWGVMRAALGFGPESLTRSDDPWEDWRSPDLLFSQTCGLPFRMELHERLHLIGAPDHQLDGCPAGFYRSVFLARKDDPRDVVSRFEGATLAFNSRDSQSGWAAPIAEGIGFSPGPETGSHRDSARAVADGRAEITALDAVTWEMLKTHDDFAGELKVVGWTKPTPALPFVTARPDMIEPLGDALDHALGTLTPSEKATLHLYRRVYIAKEDYMNIPLP